MAGYMRSRPADVLNAVIAWFGVASLGLLDGTPRVKSASEWSKQR